MFFHSIVTDYNASCLLKLESNACFSFLPGYFKSFQCLFKCAAMPIPWDCFPTAKMVSGCLGSNGRNRARELLLLTDALCISSTAPLWTRSQPLCLNELMEPRYPQLFTCERLEAKWPPWICQASGRCQPFCFWPHSFHSLSFPIDSLCHALLG